MNASIPKKKFKQLMKTALKKVAVGNKTEVTCNNNFLKWDHASISMHTNGYRTSFGAKTSLPFASIPFYLGENLHYKNLALNLEGLFFICRLVKAVCKRV